MDLEKMDAFFDSRVAIYDSHMLLELQLSEFYKEIANCFPKETENRFLLDLGCGTGLELDELLQKNPNLTVTGIDLSQGMLQELHRKYPNKNILFRCGSYLNEDFGVNMVDYVLSTYSLHHFKEDDKLKLYQKVYSCLRNDGMYVEGDYTCKTMQEQQFFLAEKERLCRENNTMDELYHVDTPFTVETQIKLFKAAGFTNIQLKKTWENTSIFVVKK